MPEQKKHFLTVTLMSIVNFYISLIFEIRDCLKLSVLDIFTIVWINCIAYFANTFYAEFDIYCKHLNIALIILHRMVVACI